MNRLQLISLINQYLNNSISDEDFLILKHYLESEASDASLMDVWEECIQSRESTSLQMDKADLMFNKILADERVAPYVGARRNPAWSYALKFLAAACLLLGLKIGLDLSQSTDLFHQWLSGRTTAQQKIVPGSSKAQILLDDGRVVYLENLRNDTTIHLKGYSIRKTAEGAINYLLDPSLSDNALVYNTIITPKGGEYKLILSDGTEVWLNSSSQVKYPVNFDSKSREVSLVGEAYFDVKKIALEGKKMPFIVHTGHQQLEVLGTEFNINSFGEQITTTLVKGKVRLKYQNQKQFVLNPSEQAIYEKQNTNVKIEKVDPFYTTAWKDGSFAFNNTSIYDVMEIVSRWYDIKIAYEGDLAGIRFTGTVSRFEQIDELLKTIELTGSVKFKIEGRRIIVMR